MLKLQSVTKKFKNKTIFEDVSVEFDKGLNIIMGQSGSGKSTLLNMLGLLDKCSSGKISFPKYSEDRGFDADRYRNENIGFVFQFFHLIPNLTVLDNILLPTYISGKITNPRSRARDLLALVGLKGYENKYPSTLSGGEMQRVTIARALINDPQIILADEPTANLDETNASIVLEIIKTIAQKKIVLFVTHSNSIRSTGDRIFDIKDKKLIRFNS